MTKKEILAFIEKLTEGSGDSRESWYNVLKNNPQLISKEFCDCISELNYDQILDVLMGLEKGLGFDTIKIYAKPDLSSKMMNSLRLVLQKKETDPEKVKLYAKKEYEEYVSILNLLVPYLEYGDFKKWLSMEEIAPWKRVYMLNFIYKHPEVSECRLKVLYNNKFGEEILEELQYWICKRKISLKQLKIIANPNFDNYQMHEVGLGFFNGLSIEQVAFYAKPEINFCRMNIMRRGFEKGFSIAKINFCSNPELNQFSADLLCKALEEGVSFEKVKYIAKRTQYFYGGGTPAIRLLTRISEYLNINDMKEVINPICVNSEYEEILDGLKSGLSIEQVKFYSTAEFDYQQMRAIKNGFKNGLSMEQVEIYAKTQFDAYVMDELRKCLEAGMSLDIVKKLANTSADSIRKARNKYKYKEQDLYKLLCEKLLDN